MNWMKRGLAALLAVLVLATVLPVGGLTVLAADEVAYPVLQEGVTTQVSINNPYDKAYFSFTPDTDGHYLFYSLAPEGVDTYGEMYYDEEWSDDDSGEYNNFRIVATLRAGITYTLVAFFWSDNTGSYPIRIEKYIPKTITAIDFHDTTVLEYSRDEHGQFSISPFMTVHFSDGSVDNQSGNWPEDEVTDYYVEVTPNIPTEEWKLGNSYVVTATVEDLNITGTFMVTVEDTPVVSVEAPKKILLEGVDGQEYEEEYWNEETEEWEWYTYTYYNVRPDMRITLKDGSEWGGSGFEWNGRWYGVECYFQQDYYHQMTKGVYTIEANLAGYEFTYEVELMDTPVASVVANPVTIVEYNNGYWTSDSWYDEENDEYVECEYFRYYGIRPTVTVTLKDGTVFENVTWFEWQGQEWNVHYDEQYYEHCLTLGTNTWGGEILGYEFTYDINVIKTPVVSVEADSIRIMEYGDGYWETDENGDRWFYYHGIYPDEYTITLMDGSVYEDEFYWNGSWYSIEPYDQSADNHLSVGTNQWKASVAGYEFTYDVVVVESPIASIEVTKPRTVMEHNNGYWQNSEHGDWFYYYDIGPRNLIITLKDGKVLRDVSGIDLEGRWYSANYDSQSRTNQLTMGTNTWTANLMGYEFTYEINVVEHPVASVDVAPIVLVENQNGYWRNYYVWNDDLDCEEVVSWFYYYDISPQYTITLKDGTVIRRSWFEWNGIEFNVGWEGQNYENRLLPGTNVCNGSVYGFEFQFTIEVAGLSSNDSYEYMETDSGVVITHTYLANETLEIPAEINGKPVIGVAGLGYNPNIKHLILPDSVVTVGDYVFEEVSALESVHFGAGVSNLYADMMTYNRNLSSITISADNPYFCVENGVLYDKAMTTFIAYPIGNGKTDYEVPATVVNINALDYYFYRRLNVTFAPGHLAFVSVDGVTYNKDMTQIISCRKDKTGDYVMPDTVETIDMGAFQGTQLTSVVVSSKVTEIVYCTFANCASLESVTLPEGLISIEMAAFDGTTALKNINLPSTLEYIGTRAFDCTGLTTLTVPGSVKVIDSSAFRSSKISTLILGEGIEEIYYEAFAYTPVTAVTLPDSLNYLGSAVFYNCASLTSLTIGSGLQEISGSAFARTGLQSVVIPGTVRYIESGAFSGSALEDVTISEGVWEIGSRVFADCDGLASVHLPSTLMGMGYAVFGDCDNLFELTVTEGKYFFGAGNCVIGHDGTVVSGCNGSVLPQDGSVKRIAEYAFADLGGLMSVNFPNSLESIGEAAYSDCDNLRSVVLPDSVKVLDISAFSGCDNLSNVELGDGLEFMGSGCFSGCPVTSLDLGESISFVAPFAFNNAQLQQVFFPSSVTDIMYYSFHNNEKLTSVEIPITVTSIEYGAFENCYALTDVYYQGSELDRENMTISDDGNETLLNATWHYNWTNANWDDIPVCEHEYDNACDANCNLCDALREVPDHVYDNTCDGECNVCGMFRPTGDHDYHPSIITPGDCGNDGLMGYDCSICGAHYEEIIYATGEHAYDNACDDTCNVCSFQRPVGDHIYDNACDAFCNICDAERAVPDHVYDDKYDADCNVCAAIREVPLRPVFSLDSGNAIIGETVNVWVDVLNNPGIYSATIDLHYDSRVLELVGMDGGVFEGVQLTTMGSSSVNVSWTNVKKEDVYGDGVMACLTFKLKDGVQPGSTSVRVGYKDGDIRNADGEVVNDFLLNDRVVNIYENVRGDADGSGDVTIRDLVEMQQNLNGWDVEVVDELLDVDASGTVGNRDYVMIYRSYAGWDIELK